MNQGPMTLDGDGLRQLEAEGALSAIACQYADFVCRRAGTSDVRLWLAAALASQAVEDSHVCVTLPRLFEGEGVATYPTATSVNLGAGNVRWAEANAVRVALPAEAAWVNFLRSEACARVIGNADTALTRATPLVLDASGRLYLHRYYVMERRLATALLAMNTCAPARAMVADALRVRNLLGQLFPHVDEPNWETNWPKVAAYAALKHRLTVITGGPGTGKTSVVGKLLLLMRGLCTIDGAGDGLKIRLAAPTGKAAARLSQGLEACFSGLKDAGVFPVDFEALQVSASTVHRLLGYRRGSIHFRHNAENPLDADLIIVDEASMVTLPQMLRLVEAVPPGARLILLGDMKQLASVESGFVLGDLCEAMQPSVFTDGFRESFGDVAMAVESDQIPDDGPATPMALSDACVELSYSWRFRPGSHVDRVSGAINKRDGVAALAEVAESATGLPPALTTWQEPGILQPLAAAESDLWDYPPRTHVWHRRNIPSVLISGDKPDPVFTRVNQLHFQSRYRAYLQAQDAGAVLAAFEQFRILCATRSGPHGVLAVNALVEGVLGLDYAGDRIAERERLGDCCLPARRQRQGHYDHRPILITENNYSLDLYNGDTGVILKNPDFDAADETKKRLPPLLAYFSATNAQDASAPPRVFVPDMLPVHETAWAMTIHKSQGSQFDDVLVVLPQRDNPVVGCELIYTAITRAKRRAELWLPPDPKDTLFAAWAARATDRHSGLVEALRR